MLISALAAAFGGQSFAIKGAGCHLLEDIFELGGMAYPGNPGIFADVKCIGDSVQSRGTSIQVL